MELWLNLLFGNPIGLMSMIVVLVTLVIICTLFVVGYNKSKATPVHGQNSDITDS